ncbi:hypothetical protein BM221_000723 [Beauveria bassiana]|uniref:Uncharacterized protein n=1 Tax=Beauveria bassiana TaxID=176275 RepID=A0A2N6P1B3_BEABA|nr:hypothetical protein BM221_000723 [Beauveria bassiana]
MARGGRGGSAPSRRPVDLTGIISDNEKSNLILLVTAITEKMFRDINSLFDSPLIPFVEGEGPDRNWLALALREQESSDKENSAPPRSFANRPIGSAAVKPSPQQHHHDDETPPQLQELRNEAVAFFRKWQASVIQRLRKSPVEVAEEAIEVVRLARVQAVEVVTQDSMAVEHLPHRLQPQC